MHLRANQLTILAAATKDGFNPFDIAADRARDVIYHEDDPAHVPEAARVLARIATPSAAQRLALLRGMDGFATSLKPIDAEICAHLGVDPLGLLAAYQASVVTRVSEFQIDAGPRMLDATILHMTLGDDDGRPELLATLSPTTVWNDAMVVVSGLPDSVAASLAGRPLRDAISHPVLDRHHLPVVGVEPRTPGHALTLADPPGDRLDAAALHRLFPARR